MSKWDYKWITVKDDEGTDIKSTYIITRDGIIYNTKTKRFISPSMDKHNYYRVKLRIKGKQYTRYYHRLLYEYWNSSGENIVGKQDRIIFKDKNTYNVKVHNLLKIELKDLQLHRQSKYIKEKG